MLVGIEDYRDFARHLTRVLSSDRSMKQTIADHIESKPEVCGGRACVAGTRIRVQDVYGWHEKEGISPDEIVSRFPQLTLALNQA